MVHILTPAQDTVSTHFNTCSCTVHLRIGALRCRWDPFTERLPQTSSVAVTASATPNRRGWWGPRSFSAKLPLLKRVVHLSWLAIQPHVCLGPGQEVIKRAVACDQIRRAAACPHMTHIYHTTSDRQKRLNGVGRWKALFLTTCSEHSKPYMILVALIKGFQNHIGFAIIRASGVE